MNLISSINIQFKKIILILLLLTLSQTVISSIVKGRCGNMDFLIETQKNGSTASEYTLYYLLNSERKKFYGPTGDWLYASCIKNKKNHELFVWQESCMGSACSDEGVYGIFDPERKKILLQRKELTFNGYKANNIEQYVRDKIYKYEEKNHQQAAEVLGYEPPSLSTYKKSFCCY